MAALLLVAASLAPRAERQTERPHVPAAVLVAEEVSSEPTLVADEVPPPVEEPKKELPQLAIGFDPVVAEAPKDRPAARQDQLRGPAVEPEEPEPIRLEARRELANRGPRIHRPFDTSTWIGPKIIVLRRGLDAAKVVQRRVPVPPQPAPRAATAAHLEKHTVRQYWERDVEQYLALARAGYTTEALRQVFGAKLPHVRSAANSGRPLATLPPPPKAYIDALASEAVRPGS